MRKLLCTIMLSCMGFVIAGCNGSSSDTGNNGSSISQTATTLNISLQNSNQQATNSFTNDQTVTINAELLDSFNQPIAGQVVTFTTTLGILATSTGLTNSQGIASVTLSADNILGAATVIASSNGLSANGNFELIASLPDSSALTILDVSLVVGSIATNQFTSADTATISAKLTNGNGAPIVDQIIDFTAELGQLSAPSALTNSLGIAEVTLSVEDDSLGAGRITATLRADEASAIQVNDQLNYQVNATEPSPEEILRLGHFDDSGEFIEGSLGISTATGNMAINAGASLGISIALVDSSGNRVMAPYQVSFSSNCVASGKATIDETQVTVNGVAQSTFEDIGCSGNQSIDDAVTATVTINGNVETLTTVFTIEPEQLGAIEFVSADPESIVLKGTGGIDKKETTTLTFRVSGDLGNPLANQQVDFSLNSTLGGLSITPTQSYTNSQGLVTTTVSSGNVPAVVRVTASTTNGDKQIATLSDLLTVNTGLPDQNSMTIAAETINVEAGNINGVSNNITVYLADSFNNPVVDGTSVNFTTEGGTIEPNCVTENGRCTVVWTSSEPRVPNHRITILATAVGHETFYDRNGNNVFDSSDGSAMSDLGVSSGLVRAQPSTSGFIDMSEAWRDDDEDQRYDVGEVFLDLDNDGSFDSADGKFNGPQCATDTCTNTQTTNVRKAAVLIMSSSSAHITVSSGSSRYLSTNPSLAANSASPSIAEGNSQVFTLTYSDTANQILPAGTTVSVSSDVGELTGNTDFTIPNSIGRATPTSHLADTTQFALKNPNSPTEPDDEALTGFVTVTVTSPSGIVTMSQFAVVLEGS